MRLTIRFCVSDGCIVSPVRIGSVGGRNDFFKDTLASENPSDDDVSEAKKKSIEMPDVVLCCQGYIQVLFLADGYALMDNWHLSYRLRRL